MTRSAISAVARVSRRFVDFARSAEAIPSTLIRSLALAENYFRHAVSNCSMMVDFGEPQVLEKEDREGSAQRP